MTSHVPVQAGLKEDFKSHLMGGSLLISLTEVWKLSRSQLVCLPLSIHPCRSDN